MALFTTLCVFAGILVATRLGAPLFAALLAASLLIGAVFTNDAGRTLTVTAEGFILPTTIGLALVNILQVVLSAVMQQGGQMRRVVDLAGQVLRRPAVSMVALPALIGLLPMPGGALFSAPMVEASIGEHSVPGHKLSAVNYWFRHIWEHWWPLYPGVLTAVALTKLSFSTFMSFQIPLGIFMALAGLLVMRGIHPDLHKARPSADRGAKRELLWMTSSIWVIILVAIPVGRLLGFVSAGTDWQKAIDKFGPIFAGLFISVIWTVFLNRMNGRTFRRLWLNKSMYTMTMLVASVMVFQHVLQATGVPGMIATELKDIKAPLILVIALLPAIAGLVTGLAVGFVATSFPIILPLSTELAQEQSILPYVALAYGFGHLGQMISPIHLCYIVSNQYFKAGFGDVYKHFLPSALVTGCATVAYFFATRWLGF